MQTNKWKQRGFFGFSKCNLYFSEYQRHYGVTVTTQTFAYKPQCIFFHLKNTPHLSCTLSSSFTHSSSVVLITISSAYCRVVPLLLSV